MNEYNEKLIMILYECNQHRKMINYSYKKISTELPLNIENYRNFDDDKIGFIDQFLFRFSKLQDSMREKLFLTFLLLIEEDYSSKPFIDMLNRLEKLGLLDKQEWIFLRKIRNDVAHEYSFNVEDLIDSLNAVFAVKDKLISIYDTFYRYCKDKFEFVKNNEIL